MATCSSSTSASDAIRLAGLWGYERIFGPEVRGELTIVRDAGKWTSEIAGFRAPVVVRDQSVNQSHAHRRSVHGRWHAAPSEGCAEDWSGVLSGGTWNGKRIVSREWIGRSTTKHSTINPESSYGYNWWVHDLRSADGRVFPAYAAEGNGGQLLPKLDLVVMFTGGNYNRYPIWRKFRDELTPQFIIAAASGK